MSDTFRFLDHSGDSSAQAAQSFLKNKLTESVKGRYSPEQMAELMASGGPSVVTASDGAMPGGPAYEADRKVTKPASSGAAGNYEGGWRANKKSGEIAWSDGWVEGGHFQQIKGKGPVDSSFDAEFSKLTKSESDVDDDGAWVTLHQQDTHGATQSAKELAAKWSAAGYDVRVQDLEGHDGVVQADIAVRKGSGTAAEKEPMKPIEHSPEIKQATEILRTYDNDVRSGKLSDDLYGDYSKRNSNSVFDSNKGIKGIGTPAGGSADGNQEAASSFLDKKKTETKNKYQFQPAQS